MISLEQIFVKVLSSGTLLRAELEPLLVELTAQATEPLEQKKIGRLIRIVRDNQEPAEVRYSNFLSVLQTFDQVAEAPLGKATQSNALHYDISLPGEILESFHAEVCSHLQNIEEQLLQLENQPANKEALNAVFGAMHSLKGVTGFLDLQSAHQIAHQAETIMERATARSSGLSRDECDLMLRVVDVIRTVVDAVHTHAKSPKNPLPTAPANTTSILAALKLRMDENTDAPVSSQDSGSQNSEELERHETRVLNQTDSVRVKVQKLDALVDTIGELLIAHSQLHEKVDQRHPELAASLMHMTRIMRQLQDTGMSMRMFPVRDLFRRMARLSRDIAHRLGKELEVTFSGEETEIDKNVIDALVDPLSHLIRNAVDHGIENPEQRRARGKEARACISISAQTREGKLVLEISDDGQGLDLAKIEKRAREIGLITAQTLVTPDLLSMTIFAPGFSTAERVTDLSGRGVGLDVVKRNVEDLQGSVSVASIAGSGTTFRLKVPQTLAIMDGLLVRGGEQRYVIPASAVVHFLLPEAGQIESVHGRGELLNLRGHSLPLIRIHDIMNPSMAPGQSGDSIVVVLESREGRYGLVVSEVLGLQQVVVKSLGRGIRPSREIIGGAILGDGIVGLVLDADWMFARGSVLSESLKHSFTLKGR